MDKVLDIKPDEPAEIMSDNVAGEALPSCQFCALWHTESSETGSRETVHFMTDREVTVLEALRRAKKEASRIKSRLRRIEADLGKLSFERMYHDTRYHEIRGKLWLQGVQEDWTQLNERLNQLRARWKELNLDRMQAEDERMRLLGHRP